MVYASAPERVEVGARPIRVLVVDDHPLMRSGVSAMLEESPDCRVAGSAGHPEEAIEQARACKPDVVLLDLRLGRSIRDRLDVARTLLSENPSIRILIHSSYEVDPRVLGLAELGVCGFILKSAQIEVSPLARLSPAHLRWRLNKATCRSAVFRYRSVGSTDH